MSRLLLEPDKMLINGKEQLFDQNQLKLGDFELWHEGRFLVAVEES